MTYKNIDFTLLGGLHTWQETLEMMQDAYGNTFDQLTRMFGNNIIVNGAVLSGGTYSPGWMIIDGLMLPFIGGVPDTYIVIEDVDSVEGFEDGTTKTVYKNKRAKFANAGTLLFADFVRLGTVANHETRLQEIEKMLKPLVGYDDGLGNIVHGCKLLWMRPASEIPAGWVDADDPAWYGRTPLVLDPADADFNSETKYGGEKKHIILSTEMPKTTITIPTVGYAGIGGSGTKIVGNAGTPTGADLTITFGGNPSNAGGAADAINVLSPYRIVRFIKYIG